LDGDSLVRLYDDTITQLLDRQVPVETKTCRRRPSNAWFDDDCRQAKHQLRSTERAALRAGQLSNLTSPLVQTWRLQRRQYFSLLRQKKSSLWTARIDSDQQRPRQLWQSFDQLLGRGRAPSTDINVSVLHKYFDDKIATVRATTAGPDEPPAEVLWSLRFSLGLVHLVPLWAFSVHPYIGDQLYTVCSIVWCSTGFGP